MAKQKGDSVVLDLGANIRCSSKDLVDFSIMGASLYKSLYPMNPFESFIKYWFRRIKGNEIIKETFKY